MESIDTLRPFFKFFEVCGLQHFSLKDVVSNKQSKLSKFCRGIYFIILLFINLISIFFYLVNLIIAIDERIAANFMTILIRLVFNSGVVAAIVAGLAESLLNKKMFQEILVLLMKLSKTFSDELNHKLNYLAFKKQLAIKVSVFYLLVTTLMASIIAINNFDAVEMIVFVILMVPQVFVVTILVVFNFYIELVNFQLKNMAKALMKTFVSYDNVQNLRNHKNKVLSIRQCYEIVCKISKLVNKVLRCSIFLVVVVFIIGLVNKAYEDLIRQIIDRRTKKVVGKTKNSMKL